MDKEQIKEDILRFYRSKSFKPILPDFPFWRHYRGKTASGAWRKCNRIISKPDQLKKWMIANKITDMFHSTSLWLNPRNISEKGRKDILIGCDLVFDIDESFSLQGLKKALKTARLLFENISPQLECKSLSFTGRRGFTLIFSNPFPLPTNYKERVSFLEQKRKLYIRDSLYRYKFDEGCLVDAYRVIRLIGSSHSKTGLICKKLPKSALFKTAEEILNTIRNVNGEKAIIPRVCKKIETEQPSNTKKTSPKKRGPTSLYDAVFITNQACRNRFVLFLKLPKQYGYKKKLRRLDQIYKLGPLWVFESDDHILCMGIRTYQRKRLQKLLNASKSVSGNEFKKYHRNYFQVSPELKFIERLDFKTSAFCSRSHFNYLISRGLESCGKNIKFHKSAILKLSKVKYKK